jgi:esterase
MQLHYESYGEGYPLIILHGLFGSLDNWRTISRRFGKCYQVFAVDQRNHGDSPHSDSMNYQVMVEDLNEFMESQELPTAHLLGHSMGGKTVMQFAATYPEKVSKLVVVDIAPRAYPPHHNQIFAALLSLDLQAFRTRQEIDAALAQRIQDSAVRQFLLMNVTRDGTRAFKWKIDLDAIYKNYKETIEGLPITRRFDKPTLFIRGKDSEYIQDGDVALIEDLFPQSRIVTINGVGHWVHARARRKFCRVALAFLAQDE